MAATFQANELGNIFHVLAKDVVIAARQNRHAVNAQMVQSLQRLGILRYIQSNEVDAFLRKKLFRSKATASTGLGEKKQSIGKVFHGLILA